MSTVFWAGPRDEPDRIRLVAAVASGAEAVLYKAALDLATGPIDVAVKMLHPGHLADLSAWSTRWLKQMDLIHRVRLPGLVALREGFLGPLPHSAGEADPDTTTLYMVMDWVDGVPLGVWRDNVDPRNAEQLLMTLVPVAAALDVLHSGAATDGIPVVHRDVKPSNILIGRDGEAVLVDIGTVRGLKEGLETGDVVGTPGYIAPEVKKRGVYGPHADRYSLGAVAYFLITGQEPPEDASIGQLREALLAAPVVDGRSEIANHVLAMLNADPTMRPQNLANWVAQLRRSSLSILPGEIVIAPRAPQRLPPRMQHGTDRSRLLRRGILAVTATAVIALTAATSFFWAGSDHARRHASTTTPVVTSSSSTASIPPAPGPTSPPLPSVGIPDSVLRTLIPVGDVVISQQPFRMDTSAVPQVAVIARSAQPMRPETMVPEYSEDLIVIGWNPLHSGWATLFDLNKVRAPSLMTPSEVIENRPLLGSSGLLLPPTEPSVGMEVAGIADQAGGGRDLVFWTDEQGASRDELLVGVVSLRASKLYLRWSFSANAGIEPPTIFGTGPNQDLSVNYTWHTWGDAMCCSGVQKFFVVGFPANGGTGVMVLSDDRAYLGVVVQAPPIDNLHTLRVADIVPGSPASGHLSIGDTIVRVEPSILSPPP
jgi:serine/threonine protein kinase